VADESICRGLILLFFPPRLSPKILSWIHKLRVAITSLHNVRDLSLLQQTAQAVFTNFLADYHSRAMKVYNLTSLCALATVVSASPLVQERSDACQVVDVVVSALKLYKATPFCSSFLGIQTATAVVTSTAVSQTTTVVPGPTTLTTVVTATM
jgi:hypothetical protein